MDRVEMIISLIFELYCCIDKDDEEDYEFSEDTITLQEDGRFLIHGDADWRIAMPSSSWS
jgi:hypothetical protein